jgi:multicomponent Na+:H+ antiporter subunit G
MGGLMVQAGLTLVTVKLAFILLFLLLIGPTATHALAKAALFSGVRPMIGKRSSGDEVADGDSTPNEASGRPPSS